MDESFSLAIATPSHRGLFTTSYVRSLWGLQQHCAAHAIPVELLTLAGSSMVDRARNILASHFLYRTSFTHLLFIDDDMGFEVGDLVRMFGWRHYDVVAAMYCAKGFDWQRVKDIVLARPDIDAALLAQLAVQCRGMQSPATELNAACPDEPVPVTGIGAGLMLISRACLERLVAQGVPAGAASPDTGFPVHAFFRQKIVGDRLLGEDFYFCHLVRELGGQVYGCAWPTVTHTGQYDFVANVQQIVQVTGAFPQ